MNHGYCMILKIYHFRFHGNQWYNVKNISIGNKCAQKSQYITSLPLGIAVILQGSIQSRL